MIDIIDRQAGRSRLRLETIGEKLRGCQLQFRRCATLRFRRDVVEDEWIRARGFQAVEFAIHAIAIRPGRVLLQQQSLVVVGGAAVELPLIG